MKFFIFDATNKCSSVLLFTWSSSFTWENWLILQVPPHGQPRPHLCSQALIAVVRLVFWTWAFAPHLVEEFHKIVCVLKFIINVRNSKFGTVPNLKKCKEIFMTILLLPENHFITIIMFFKISYLLFKKSLLTTQDVLTYKKSIPGNDILFAILILI